MRFQDEIRRNERKLRVALATFVIAAIFAGAVFGEAALRWCDPATYHTELIRHGGPGIPLHRDPRLLYAVTGLFVASAYVMFLNRKGVEVILALVGNPQRAPRQLENIAEEMAIAAQAGAPRLRVLDDPAPNAFACGTTRGAESVIVTRGLLELLDRDELQAVVAHELAHIVRGDTRRMTTLLGIATVFQLVGWVALGPLAALGFAATLRTDEADEPDATVGRHVQRSAVRPRTERRWQNDALMLLVAIPFVVIALLGASVVVAVLALATWSAFLLAAPILALAWLVYECVARLSDRKQGSGADGGDFREEQPDSVSVSRLWLLFLVPCGLVIGPAVVLLGVVMPVFFFMLRLGISRQQEYLADAQAVEWTRQSEALARALRRIHEADHPPARIPKSVAALCIMPRSTRALRRHVVDTSWIDDLPDAVAVRWFRRAVELCHRVLSTHPPLDERLRRLGAKVVLES